MFQSRTRKETFSSWVTLPFSFRLDCTIRCRVEVTRIVGILSNDIYVSVVKERGKNSWVTFASLSSSQRGRKKNCRPLSAPSRVRDRMRKTTIKRNGRVAVRYLTCADDFMDFQTEKYTIIQAVIRQATSSHLNAPDSSIPLLIWSTLLLDYQMKERKKKKEIIERNISWSTKNSKL